MSVFDLRKPEAFRLGTALPLLLLALLTLGACKPVPPPLPAVVPFPPILNGHWTVFKTVIANGIGTFSDEMARKTLGQKLDLSGSHYAFTFGHMDGNVLEFDAAKFDIRDCRPYEMDELAQDFSLKELGLSPSSKLKLVTVTDIAATKGTWTFYVLEDGTMMVELDAAMFKMKRSG